MQTKDQNIPKEIMKKKFSSQKEREKKKNGNDYNRTEIRNKIRNNLANYSGPICASTFEKKLLFTPKNDMLNSEQAKLKATVQSC